MRGSSMCFALVCCAWQASAQLYHGPRFGAAVATQTAGGSFSWTGLPRVGPIAGWSFEAPWKRQLSFCVEPMLMSKGSWRRDAVTRTNTVVTHRFLELPVLARVDLQRGEGGMFIDLGLVYGYWVYGRVRTTVDGTETFDVKMDLAQPQVNRSQWSVSMGFGQQGDRWSWELRAEQSVTPFDRLVRSQNLVYGLHFTYRLLSAAQREALMERKQADDTKEPRERRSEREDEIP